MELLKQMIKEQGKIYPGDVLKVDMFLNHQIDPKLMDEMSQEIYRLFADTKPDKIMTIEASGIAIAIMVALKFNVPMVFAKKSKTSNISSTLYCAPVLSYTHGITSNVVVSKEYLKAGEKVLIVDDFLATGNALLCLLEIVRQAGAIPVGCAIAVEKEYQGGGEKVRSMGVRLESMAVVASMTDNNITFA